MTDMNTTRLGGAAFCWITAVAVGVLAYVLLITRVDISGIGAVFVAAVVALILGIALHLLFARELTPIGAQEAPVTDSQTARAPLTAPAAAEPQAHKAPQAEAGGGHWSETVQGQTAEAGIAPAGGMGASGLKPSTELSDEATLRDRVGSWRYEGEAVNETSSTAETAAEPVFDTLAEVSSEGEKPQLLTAARDGGPDDLKRISGVGPKMEQMLHEMGIYHFDQVAGWSPDEVAWVDQNLPAFKGRVSRDNWVEQAKALAAE